MTMRHAPATCLIGVAILLSFAAPAAAQFGVSLGASNYDSDEFCLNTEAFFSFAEVSYGGDAFGASVSAMNSDIPWPIPPGPGSQNTLVPASFALAAARQQEEQYLSQGEAIQASAEVFIISALRRMTNVEGRLATIDRYLRPYVGIGVLFVTDGEPAGLDSGRGLPTLGLRSFVAPVVTYGARLYVPSRDNRLGLLVQYRGNSAFASGLEYEAPDGELLAIGDETLTWGTWSIGVSFRVGG